MAALAVSNTASAASATDLTTYTHSTLSLGAAPGAGERRFIVVPVVIRRSTAVQASIVSVSAGGVALAAIAGTFIDLTSQGANSELIQIWWGEVPTGTTGDVVVVANGACFYCGVGVVRILSDSNGVAVHDVVTDVDTVGPVTLAGAIDTIADGGLVAAIKYSKSTATVASRQAGASMATPSTAAGYTLTVTTANTPDAAWTDLAEGYDAQLESSIQGNGSHLSAVSFASVAGRRSNLLLLGAG